MTARTAPAGDGRPEPLGASLVGGGANVAVHSRHATRISVCLFDAAGERETGRVVLSGRSGDVHHGFVPGLAAGGRYGLRAEGAFDPARGLFFNPAKLLVDPYATALDRPFALSRLMVPHTGDGRTICPEDSAPVVPKAIVTPLPPSLHPHGPRVSSSERVVYELNVRGFTKRHPDVPELKRGTVAALAEPAVIAHLARLGVTSLELMPIAAFVDERHLAPLGLSNAWGYNPVTFLAPDPRLAPGGLAEIRHTVTALHAAGFEVILDVVFNHTGESDLFGPSLSLRGLDGLSYYRHDNDGHLINDTGCGNTLACDRPEVIRLVLDALRHWVVYAGVDGFRFDLAVTLGRRVDGFATDHPLLVAITQDPVLRDRVLIVEPWDVGPGGHRLGGFGHPFLEWNDRYRDDVRRFWRGDGGLIGALATRLAGSSDIFQASGRGAAASVNFVACHDGFTLADLVAHTRKHNEANGENNRDGTDNNISWNHGIEGISANPSIIAARARDVRAMLSTLLLSRGTPMFTAGDELGHSQGGNNNAYAQDNATTWLDWSNPDARMIDFVAHVIRVRQEHAILRDAHFLTGRAIDGSGLTDIVWLAPTGLAMTVADWERPGAQVLGCALARASDDGSPQRVLLYFNAGWNDATVSLPDAENERVWRELVDSAAGAPARASETVVEGLATTTIPARAVRLFVAEPVAAMRPKRRGVDPNVLLALADAVGMEREWWTLDGATHVVSPETMRAILVGMNLPCATTAQARDSIAHLKARATARPAKTAPPCFEPPAMAGDARRFGLAAHLYALRHATDMGVGDFETLARFAEMAGRSGAALVGVNPFHALFATDRDRASPYYPSDRRFLDPIYIDVAALPNLDDAPRARALLESMQPRIAHLRGLADVDYPAVAALKNDVLDAAFTSFDRRRQHGSLPREIAVEYERFVVDGGEMLERFALFEAIAEKTGTTDRSRWRADLASATSSGVPRARETHARAIRFALFKQWIADRQLAQAAARGRAAGLAIGIYRDLAVGAAPDGAETWTAPDDFVKGVSVGAPPDPFAAEGQIWGVPPLDPLRLRDSGCAAFRALLAANMRHAGALRIDHAMSLTRLFYVPHGARGIEGAYVRYPFEDMLTAAAEESHRARCLVVGEDLGTVPWGFRERLAQAAILSMKIALFERDGTAFRRPQDYGHGSVASFGTHDLPTIAGWMQGLDIALDESLGRNSAADAAARRIARRDDIVALSAMMRAAGRAVDLDPAIAKSPGVEVLAALHGALATASSALVLVQADDLSGETTPLNLPGTDREHPNWRRRLAITLEVLERAPVTRAVIAALSNRVGPRGS